MGYKNRKTDYDKLAPEVEKVLKKIDEIENWDSYKINEITQFEPEGDALVIAKHIAEDKDGPKSAQLRKFYDEALNGLTALKQKNQEEAKIVLSMLKPRVLYAKNREQRLVGLTFTEFIKHATNLSKFRDGNLNEFIMDYQKFIHFFESIVGYSKYYQGRN